MTDLMNLRVDFNVVLTVLCPYRSDLEIINQIIQLEENLNRTRPEGKRENCQNSGTTNTFHGGFLA
jgi:hypothetical protein